HKHTTRRKVRRLASPTRVTHQYSGRRISMRVKSNKAPRRSARLARRAPSPVVALPAAASSPRRPWLRIGAANSVAAAVAGILYGSGGVAYAQEQAGAGAAGAEALQEVVVTATAQAVKKLDASYSIVSASQADTAMVSTSSIVLRCALY